MANTPGLSAAMVQAALGAVVDGATIKGALYLETASIGPTTPAYTSAGEVTGTGYTAGGVAITNGVAAALTGTVAYWTPGGTAGKIVFPDVTISDSFDTLMLYRGSDDLSFAVCDIGPTTITAGTLSLTLPANAAATAMIQLSATA